MKIVFHLRPRRALWFLFGLAIFLAVLSITDDILLRVGGRGSAALEPLLQSEAELSLPRWYSSLLLFLCAAVAGSVAQRAARPPLPPGTGRTRAWVVLALGFLLLCAGKDTSLKLVALRVGGALLRAVHLKIPRAVSVGAILIVTAAALLPFLRSLDGGTVRRLLLAGAVYLAGVVVLDFGTVVVWRLAGAESLQYALSSAVEELVEMSGAILVLRALFCHIEWMERGAP